MRPLTVNSTRLSHNSVQSLGRKRSTVTPQGQVTSGVEILRISLILLLGQSPIVAVTQAAEIDVKLPTIEIQSQQWCRHAFQVDSKEVAEAQLSVAAAAATLSVYLNGQRLVRKHKPNSSRLTWNVSKLMRSGRNCVAIAAATDDVSGSISVQFTVAPQWKLAAGTWKTTSSTPPVGWQQTDFNDRDWTSAKSVKAPSTLASWKTHAMHWEKDGGGHFRNGHLRLRDGDHVVMLGGTFIERAQKYGHLESAINAMAGGHSVTFRNLGWSADTVFAESRGIFDSPEKGYERMVEHVRAEEPTVIMVCYGQNEAMTFPAGAEGLKQFRAQLGILHRDLTAAGAEIVYLSPHPLLSVSAPLPDPTHWNERIEEFSGVVREFATSRNAGYVDLFSDLVSDVEKVHGRHMVSSPIPVELLEHSDLQSARNTEWTANGLHWNDSGYERLANVVACRMFGEPLNANTLRINLETKSVLAVSGKVRSVRWASAGENIVSFEYSPKFLSAHPLVVRVSRNAAHAQFFVTETFADSKTFALVRSSVADSEQMSHTDFVSRQTTSYTTLRDLTARKNELYFHRWRPQNITYLFGFRKHEQGNNASEIARFDPLIDDLEEQIHAAKQPLWRTISISAGN